MARILSRLQQLLADVNSGLDDVAALVRLDTALTTRVVQISNSPWFKRGGEACRTIEEAVNRVGFKEVYHVVSVAASKAVVAQPLPAYGRDAETMWRESVVCAFAAELVAERVGEDTAVAYMNGLLHAVGRVAIHRCLGAVTGDPHRILADEGFPREHGGAEAAILGFTQADVGACLLQKWGFPPENSEPIRHQYQPLAAEVPHDRMTAVLYAGRFLRTALCRPAESLDPSECDDVLGTVRLTRDELLEVKGPLEATVARALQMLHA